MKPKSPIPPQRNPLAADSLDGGLYAFGPTPQNAWTSAEETLSFVRRAAAPRPVAFDAAPQRIEIDLTSSAVVVVDMQNDFCHPEGWFGQKGLGVDSARVPIPTISALLPPWRAAGGSVIWLNWGIRQDRANLSPTIHFKGKQTAEGVGYGERSPNDHGPSLVQGTWGAQVIDELPREDVDLSVFKHRLSGFWDNELDSILRQRRINTLLFVGVNTDRCVYSTLQDGAFLGYDCVLLEDACSTSSPEYVSKAIHFMVRQLHGFTATAADVVSALSALQKQDL